MKTSGEKVTTVTVTGGGGGDRTEGSGSGSGSSLPIFDNDIYNVSSIIQSDDFNKSGVTKLMCDHISGWESSSIPMSITDFRSSENLRRLIILLLAANLTSIRIDTTNGNVTSRGRPMGQLNSFVTIASTTLCTPRISSMLGVGSSFLNEEENALELIALKSNLAKLLWVFLASDNLLHQIGYDSCLDNLRANVIVNLICLQISIKDRSRLDSVNEVTMPVLRYFTGNILSSRALCEEAKNAMSKAHTYAKKVANNNSIKSNTTATINITTTHTPATTINTTSISSFYTQLEEIFCDYFAWLRSNLNALRLASRNADLIASIDAGLRKDLKVTIYLCFCLEFSFISYYFII